MLRDLVMKLRPSTKNQARRLRRGNRLRSLLSLESLEDRLVLATNVTVTPVDGVFGLQNFEYDYQKLATFTITTDDFNLPAFEIDWGGADGGAVGLDRSLQWVFTRQDISFEPGGVSTFTGYMYGTFNYLDAGPKTAVITTTIPGVEMFTTNVSVQVAAPVVGPDNVLNIIPPLDNAPNPDPGPPPVGPAFEGQPVTFEVEADFGPDVFVDELWIDWGDGIQKGIGPSTTSISHTYADDPAVGIDLYKVSIVAIVDGQFFGATSGGVFVKDLAPTVEISGAASVEANETYTLNLSSSDVPEDQPFVWAVCWDYTGTETDVFEQYFDNPSSVTHVYDSDGPRQISAIMIDDDGVSTPSNIFAVTVGSKPTADAGGPYTTFADLPITLTGVGANGNGLTYAWDLDDDGEFGETGEVGEVVTFDPAGITGTRTVKFKVTDENGVESDVDEATIEVLATGSLVIDGTLHVVGSSTGGDTVSVSVSGGDLVVNDGSSSQSFSLSSLADLNIRTGGGNDIINIAAAVTVPTAVDAGDGNDLILGGSGRSVLNGGDGTDIIYGGAGDDVLQGGTGNDLVLGGGGNDAIVGGGGVDILEGGAGLDLLVGGVGSDALLGGAGDDILIGGYTIHDGNVAALDSVMSVWTNGTSLTARVNLLTAVGGLLQANQAVFDDDAIDIVTGGAGADMIIADRSLLGDGAIDLIALQTAQDRLIALN